MATSRADRHGCRCGRDSRADRRAPCRGHLLPRELGEIAGHAGRFVVGAAGATRRRRARTGAAEPRRSRRCGRSSWAAARAAPASAEDRRRADTPRRRRPASEAVRLHAHAGYFVHMGFSIVPHVWLPEKILMDCHSCPHFRRAASTRCCTGSDAPPLVRAADGAPWLTRAVDDAAARRSAARAASAARPGGIGAAPASRRRRCTAASSRRRRRST